MTTHAESINLDLQRGLDRRLRHTTLNIEHNQLAIKVSADNQYYRDAVLGKKPPGGLSSSLDKKMHEKH